MNKTRLLALILTAASLGAQPRLPAAKEVLDRYAKALGGKEAILKHTSSTTHGRFQIPAQKIDVELTIYARQFKHLTRAVRPNGQTSESGYDGAVAWQIGVNGNAQILEGNMLESVRRDADLYYAVNVLNYFKSFETADVITFEGRPCFHMKGVTNWGKQNEQFYDTSTGLLAGYRFASDGGGAEMTVEVFEDYKDFGGLLSPTRMTWRRPDGIQIQTIQSISYGDVDDSVFALPGPVKEILKQRIKDLKN